MPVLADTIEKASARRVVAVRQDDEDLRKAAEDRAQQVKDAMAAAKKKYGGKIPPDVRKKILKDPAGWLGEDSGESEEPGDK